MPCPAMMSCLTLSRCSGIWLCMATGLRPSAATEAQDWKGWHGPYVRPSTWPCPERNHIHPVMPASLSSMQSFWVSTVPDFFGPHTALSATHTHHIGQDWSSGLGTVIPKSSLKHHCLGGQGNDQHIWSPHFPFYLRTNLRQSLFKLIFSIVNIWLFFFSFNNTTEKGTLIYSK